MGLKEFLQRFPRLYRWLSCMLMAVKRGKEHARLRRIARTQSPLRIVLGAGGTDYEGWTPTQQWFLDLLIPEHWDRCFRPGSIDAMLAEHVWEHMDEEEGREAARVCFRYLKPGGYIRVAVPDGWDVDPEHIERARPGGTGPGAGGHKVHYTWPALHSVFESAGFEVHMLEYYDNGGTFHYEEWDPADGMIRRSKLFDGRIPEGRPHYASIMLDARRAT